MDAVADGWCFTLLNIDACHILDHKLWNTAKSLKRWSQKYLVAFVYSSPW
jgi:hypothetical protein